MNNNKLSLPPLLIAMRPGQWLKNLTVFAAIIFNGKLFVPSLFNKTFWGFLIFCLLSSASYLVNDTIDVRYDRLHPLKKFRPIASGALTPGLALETALFLMLAALIFSLRLSFSLFGLGILFITIHLLYSSNLKKLPALDILAIASSFVIRIFAGEVLTGYHLPVWLMLTVVFLSLFIASGKRRSEFVLEGGKTRPVLFSYRRQLLDFYTSTFATAAMLSYSLFTFYTEPPKFSESVTRFLLINFPKALGRKWLMAATIPFVIFGVMRYAQIVYEEQKGEKPENLLISDLPLFLAILGWGLMVIAVIYVA